MSVQEDLQMSFQCGKVLVDGLVDMGQFSEDMSILNTHKKDLKPASHILQFVFLSYDGFRFPIAYFPTCGATAPDLYINVWDAISKLYEIDVGIDYLCFDGGSSNTAFQLMHFENEEDAALKNYTTVSPYRQTDKLTLIMDYSHNIKKIRNNIHSSGDHEVCTRKLKLNDHYVIWKYWVDAYNWDRYHNPMRIHPKITDEHIFLTKPSKMCNHLAEEVLDKDMLYLMTKFQESRKDGSYLNSTIELLTHTSEMVEIFRDRRPISDISDIRLQKLNDTDSWLKQWNKRNMAAENLS